MSMSYKIKICTNCKQEFLWSRGMLFSKMTCSPKCRREQMQKKRFTTNNPVWKGGAISIRSLHCWVRDNFIRTKKCECCGKKGMTDWSNKEHDYKRDRKGWQEFCRSCHLKYDYAKGFRTRSRKKRIKKL